MRRWLLTPRLVIFVALTVLVQTTAGCLSNEYRISRPELQRLAALPPEVRGQHVRVLQELGSRRGHAAEPTAEELAPPLPPEGTGAEWGQAAGGGDGPHGNLDVQIVLDGSGSGRARPSSPGGRSGGWRAPQNAAGGRGTATASGWRGSPPGTSGSGFRGTPPRSASGGGTGGGRFSLPGGGGGGDGPEALVVLAVIVVALAAVASVFLVASEGMRFDGHAQLHPDQALYLKTDGGDRIVSLGTLSAQDAALAKEALVMDDEAPGLRRLDSVPLNRKGPAFKMDLGTSAFTLGSYAVNGMASHIQLGYFPTQTFGLMVDATLSGAGAADVIAGDVGQVPEGTLIRHSLALELQAFPLALGRFHLGGFVKGGFAVIGPADGPQTGPVGGGGALIEIGITPRLALTLRAGLDAARLDDGWSRAGVLTAGVSIY